MNLKNNFLRRLCIILPIALIASSGLLSQSRIPPQYQKKDRISVNPLSVSLQVGWGFLANALELHPLFANTQNTVFGGPHLAGQVLFPIPFVWDHLTLGLDGWYHRIAKRYMGEISSVYYTGTDGTQPQDRVASDETISGIGVLGIADVLIFPQLHFQVGGGYIFLIPSKVNVLRDVTGLTPSTTDPAAYAAFDISFVRYDRGSVDLYIKSIREFGKYTNLIIQVDLGFAFRF